MRTTYALVFKDGDPFINSISHSKKKTIKLAKDYFGLSWKEIKNTGMRCVEIDVKVKESNKKQYGDIAFYNFVSLLDNRPNDFNFILTMYKD